MQLTELKQLPDWLLEQLPQITEPAILSLRDTKLVVTYPDRMEAIHESLKDVQHQIHHVKPTDLQIYRFYQRFINILVRIKRVVAYFLKSLSIFLVVCFPTQIKINLSIYNLLYRLPLKMSKHISQIQRTF